MHASTSGRLALRPAGMARQAPSLALVGARRFACPSGRRVLLSHAPAAGQRVADPGYAPGRALATSQAGGAADPATVDDFAADPRPVMLYDGVCGLCNGGVDAALRLDGKRALRFAALQSPAGRRLLARSGRDPADISSVVLVTADGKAFRESEAIVQIGKVLGVLPAPLAALALALPPPGRDAAYRAVADNRYSIFGKRDVCRLTQGGVGPGGDPGRFLVE